MSIASAIQSLYTDKENIRQAIISKNVNVPTSEKLVNYPAYIESIQQGSINNQTGNSIVVDFINGTVKYNGTTILTSSSTSSYVLTVPGGKTGFGDIVFGRQIAQTTVNASDLTLNSSYIEGGSEYRPIISSDGLTIGIYDSSTHTILCSWTFPAGTVSESGLTVSPSVNSFDVENDHTVYITLSGSITNGTVNNISIAGSIMDTSDINISHGSYSNPMNIADNISVNNTSIPLSSNISIDFEHSLS